MRPLAVCPSSEIDAAAAATFACPNAARTQKQQQLLEQYQFAGDSQRLGWEIRWHLLVVSLALWSFCALFHWILPRIASDAPQELRLGLTWVPFISSRCTMARVHERCISLCASDGRSWSRSSTDSASTSWRSRSLASCAGCGTGSIIRSRKCCSPQQWLGMLSVTSSAGRSVQLRTAARTTWTLQMS